MLFNSSLERVQRQKRVLLISEKKTKPVFKTKDRELLPHPTVCTQLAYYELETRCCTFERRIVPKTAETAREVNGGEMESQANIQDV